MNYAMEYTYYSYLIMIAENSDASIEKLEIKLKQFYQEDYRKVEITRNDNTITINIEGWEIYVRYADAPYVLLDSQKIADSHASVMPEKEMIAHCKARFEMYAMDDPEMEYFNDCLYVQDNIEEFKDVFTFEPHEGLFLNLE